MLLSRMKSDCDYYLGNGNRSKNHLWASDEKDQIACMKALWDSFSERDKPEWLTYEELLSYEQKMCLDPVSKAERSQRMVSCVRNGESEVQEVPFDSLRKGDTFFVGNEAHVVEVDAHYSGDASYDGYLLYDTTSEGWFPEDLDGGVEAHNALGKDANYFDFGSESVTWVYYNPDSLSGGQFVELTIPYDTVANLALRYKDPEDFFDALLHQSNATQYLIDRGTEEFEKYNESLGGADARGCTVGTMKALVAEAQKHVKLPLSAQIDSASVKASESRSPSTKAASIPSQGRGE